MLETGGCKGGWKSGKVNMPMKQQREGATMYKVLLEWGELEVHKGLLTTQSIT
jgi:hypothetical protein